MVSRRAQKAGTAPWRTMAEQLLGSTSARKVSARAASSMMSALCSLFSQMHLRWAPAKHPHDLTLIRAIPYVCACSVVVRTFLQCGSVG